MNEVQKQGKIAELKELINALKADKAEADKLLATIEQYKDGIEKLIAELKGKLVTLEHDLPF